MVFNALMFMLSDTLKATALALKQHPQVNWVRYAALESSPDYQRCQRLCGGQASGILSFGIQGE